MKPNQIELFALRKPLLDRLGPELFRAAPKKPGIYIMTGDREQVLYVGQSGNLRNRLGSYKNARDGRAQRKIMKLVSAVKNITWETCATATEARLRENALLRLHRPKYNSMGVFPRGYCFLFLRLGNTRLELARSQNLIEGMEGFGAFKGSARLAYGALLRALWTKLFRPESLSQFPPGLLGEKTPREFSFDLSKSSGAFASDPLFAQLRDFLAGRSPALLETFSGLASERVSKFEQAFFSRDLETLQHFYTFGPARNLRLQEDFALENPIISQEDLDDLLVHSAPPLREPSREGVTQP